MRAKFERLVLFDIDGTLLHCGPTPRRVFKRALEQVFGTAGPIDGWIFDGKTDPLIVQELMEAAGVAWSQEQIAEALSRYVRYLEAELSNEPARKVFPGVRELLSELEARFVLLGLLTGNMRAGARVKLESLGLWDYFPCGGFADDSPLRHLIASAAVERAEQYAGRRFSGREIVIVGDTPHDMQCGRHLGARAVGVATGRSSVQQLLDAGAESAVADFSDTGRSIELLLS